MLPPAPPPLHLSPLRRPGTPISHARRLAPALFRQMPPRNTSGPLRSPRTPPRSTVGIQSGYAKVPSPLLSPRRRQETRYHCLLASRERALLIWLHQKLQNPNLPQVMNMGLHGYSKGIISASSCESGNCSEIHPQGT